MVTLKLQLVMAFVLIAFMLTSCGSVAKNENRDSPNEVQKKHHVRIYDRRI